jgi:hypothetical protein
MFAPSLAGFERPVIGQCTGSCLDILRTGRPRFLAMYAYYLHYWRDEEFISYLRVMAESESAGMPTPNS